jgi:membrane fusion protein, protease secretion system
MSGEFPHHQVSGGEVLEAPNRNVTKWMRDLNPYDPSRLDLSSHGDIEPILIEEKRIKRSTSRVFAIAFLAFLVWAFVAPIDSGVTVNGTVVVKGNRKAVQHPTGGVVEDIFVQEGDTVKKGDMLVRINQLSTNAALNTTELDYINASAVESRLLAERDGKQQIEWLPNLAQMVNDPRVEEAKRQQTRLFHTRNVEVNSQLRVLRERMAGLKDQAGELSRVIQARSRQSSGMSDEVAMHNQLAARGFISRSRVNEVMRSQSDVIASLATSKADLGKARSEIAATQLQIDQHMATYHREIESQLAETQKLRNALHTKVNSLKFDMSLTEIRAPIDGRVLGVKVNTVGGVIQAGAVMMEVAPDVGPLIVEAQVPPNLIDKVKTGLDANMYFTAFNTTTTPVIPGIVKMVGADRLVDNMQQKPLEFYLAQIETTADGAKQLSEKRIQAGMPVDVIIKTGERTFASYLIKPVTDRFAKAFKED